MQNNGDSIDPALNIFNPSGDPSFNNYFRSGINLQDGNWHSVVMRSVRNNNTNSTNNITVTVWFDDWNMEGVGHEQIITVPGADSNYSHIELCGNWSASYADELISMDIDKVEIWDGIPSL